MEFIMDMVHHNPGEPPFETAFLTPKKLKDYGYNAQVFKHINTAITFKAADEHLFDDSSDALDWILKLSDNITKEIAAAKRCGLKVYYHIDLFVLPTVLKEKFKDEICDENGKISIDKEKTLELHTILFDELFTRFPDVDGLIIRVGETYLHDTPYHTGSGAVNYSDSENEKRQFIKLIKFLCSEICEKHNRYLFFRTWDCFPDKFHANSRYYLDITDNIEPHEKLIFSIKHTALDFWRCVKFNECLTLGKHRQIIEVQCQREYEGKGAYPMYVMNGVIHGFSEMKNKKGISDIADNPLICGIYTWSCGGGWYGPYIKNEFWCDLNAYVISSYAANPQRSEEEIFLSYAKNIMRLSDKDAEQFRILCLKAGDAVLKGRYIEAYDSQFNESIMPCENWMRDDRLGGLRQLDKVFDYLYRTNTVKQALDEKKESLELWYEVKTVADTITIPDKKLSDFINTGILYAIKLYTVIYNAWLVMAETFAAAKSSDSTHLVEYMSSFDNAWADYISLSDNPSASSLYTDEYLNEPGLRETIEKARQIISETTV